MDLQPLERDFYAPSAESVSPALLGHYLLRRIEGQWIGGEIIETEAYTVGDPACHAYVRQSKRNATMFGQMGMSYVYRIYGSYFCFNAVCCEEGVAEAVLVRAIESTFGVETMRKLRPVKRDFDLTNGPSKLCIAQSINLELDGVDICNINSPLIIARNPNREEFLEARSPLVQTTRIGITKAADWPFRWFLGGSKFVSVREKRLKTAGTLEI
jgi:DNA-3-methyladenine glycosylase